MDYIENRVLYATLCMTRQCWEQGMLAQALLETHRQELLELVVYDMVLRQSADGRLCNVENTPAVTDSAFCIPAVLNETKYEEKVEANIRFFLEQADCARDGTLYHMINTKEIWADSAAFLPYALALTGRYEEAFRQIKGICSRLYQQDKRLYYHIWDEEKESYLRPVAWGVGNGWILTGLMRLLLVWNEEDEAKQWLKERFYDLLEQLLKLETDQGGFHDVLDQPDSFVESETAAMIAYVLYRGIREKLLDTAYLHTAERIRMFLHKKVMSNGLVLDAAGSPSFEHPGTSVECQAHFLMMEYYSKNV